MNLRILHVYPELLNLYGEYANLSILTRYLTEEGVSVTLDRLAYGEALPEGYDMLYFGCGTEVASLRALEVLWPYRGILESYRTSGAVILATGNSLDLFGTVIEDDRDGSFPALGLFPFTVARTHKTRYLGDAILTTPLTTGQIIGFVNKCSQIKGVSSPLFLAEMGMGNEIGSPAEGILDGNFFGASLIGPLLIRNPALCRVILDRLYERSGYRPDRHADMSLQTKAYTMALTELSERMRKG